jgi:hypothetical protein
MIGSSRKDQTHEFYLPVGDPPVIRKTDFPVRLAALADGLEVRCTGKGE